MARTTVPTRPRSARAPTRPPSIRAVRCLFRPDPDRPGRGEWIFWCEGGDAEVALKRWVGGGLPKLEPRRVEVIVPARAGADWEIRTVEARALDLLPGLSLLSRVEANPDPLQRVVVPSDSIVAWSHAAKFALELVAAGRFLPSIEAIEEAGNGAGAPGRYWATWAVVLGRDEDRERFRRLARAMPACAYAWPDDPADDAERPEHVEPAIDDADDLAEPAEGDEPEPEDDDADIGDDADSADDDADDEPRFTDPGALLRDFLDAAADTLFRISAAQSASRVRAAPRDAPAWVGRWLTALTGPDASFAPQGLPERHVPDELWAWSLHALGAGAEAPFRVLFHLTRPPDAEPEDAPWRLEYLLQSADDPAQVLPLAAVWSIKSGHARLFGRVVREPHDTVLRALGEAARAFPPIESSLRRPRPSHVNLRAGGAWLFIKNSAPLLQLMGQGVRIPVELDQGGERRLHAQLEVSGALHGGNGNARAARAEDAPVIDWQSPARFRWQVVLDSHVLPAAEFRSLTRNKRAITRWHDRWVCIDPADLATLAKVVHGGPKGTGSLAEALALSLRGTAPLGPGLPEVPVVALGELQALVAALRARENVEASPPKSFVGVLRPYQARGLSWLQDMHQHGLGGILADDMGLGKTIELLALLDHVRVTEAPELPSIVICPTSVLGNWQREAARFAPSLRVYRHHGPDRATSVGELTERVPAGALVMTTYATARIDADVLARMRWYCAVLDEAQNVKNPQAAQSEAVRELDAPRRFALTGTPVENRLDDLWSILDWCNPGLLGPLETFRRAVARPIERYRDPLAATRLRAMVQPFVLRRLKSDPEIAPDLPEKIVATVACSLSAEQVRLYKKAVTDAWTDIRGRSGMQRRGRILALLTALKQICNHPAHFLKEEAATPNRAGKLARLLEMLEEVASAGDRALIFTQYVEMGHLLVARLDQAFGWEVPFLHGGVPARARDVMVERFQEDAEAAPVFVLSLKAGGTGLNLTRANHVFHYDQWWNPAVEDQASDRTHRIGQTQTVYVHRLVSTGTLEEKISAMLDAKRGLAEIAVGVGEQWLTELGDDELRALVDLSADAVVLGEET